MQFWAGSRIEALTIWPQAIAGTRRDPSRAARALRGRGLRDGHSLEPAHAARRIETGLTREARIHHRAHAGQGHARFRDIGRQDYAPCSAWRQQACLLSHIHLAVERFDRNAKIRQTAHRAINLRFPRQKAQHIAIVLFQREAHCALEMPLRGFR